MKDHDWKRNPGGMFLVICLSVLACDPAEAAQKSSRESATPNWGQNVDSVCKTASSEEEENPDQVLEWNQIFIDTLVATSTPNAFSQRLGAIVHAAIFDAYNGVEHRYSPILVQDWAPPGASRRAAVIAAGYTALVALFPSRQPALDANY